MSEKTPYKWGFRALPLSMKIMVVFAASAATAAASVSTFFAFRPTASLQLLAMGLSAVALGSSAYSAVEIVRQRAWLSPLGYLALIAPVAAVWFGPDIGGDLRGLYFNHYLPQMTSFARSLPPLELSEGVRWKDVPVSSGITRGGHKYVYFWWGSGFSARHSVFAYHSGSMEEMARDFEGEWRHGRVLAEHWIALR